ncbi:kinase-like domain-containing protein [Gamsiella multidivaricata]|uniref:kinase-like domain-containing protein n=1 Tax=Gamsiella multidivaricata TaxID=101098 RepID=UPI00222049B1|nr:kinase-like domain-containing protein [Gamsiella multidivaricata]KAI7816893.1 kinase-like domain-containing protein [Gamsiella multidivaricata]
MPVKETHTMMKDYDPTTGNKMINKYMVVRELGRGVHGKVKLCRDTVTDELCAIKIVDKTTRRRLGRAQISNEQKIRREIAIMKKCIHPNVVRLIEVIDDPNARKIYLVLEYMEGGEVRWKDSDDRPILLLGDARAIFRDVVLGLEYLHMQGIIHRDIKPANLLLSGDGTVKISDFGVSHFSEKNALEHDLENTPPWGDDLELAKTAGSPAFFAPELCYASNTGQGYASRPPITKAIDIWALGVTLYCFVYGRCPFIAETEFELFNIIPRKQPSYPDFVPGREFVSPSLKDLLSRLLEKDVSRRITLKEVKEHPWVIEDMLDPELWRIETDPGNYQRVHVTDEDLKGAVTIMEKIKTRIRRLSVSLTNFTLNRRRRSKSISSTHTPGIDFGTHERYDSR